MSQENVDVVRSSWRAYTDEGIDAAAEYFADDCVSEDVPDLPDRATYRGREGVRERERHFRETWGDWAWEPVEFIDAGDDVVVAVVAMRARGRGSGAPVELEAAAFVYELRDGRIVRDRAFTSRRQALEAAGLSE
jgi:ketosteroid isomerase-like protein